jgi:hypothetical protein
MEQATFLIVCAAVGWICYKWGFDEGVIMTSNELADQEAEDQTSAK